MRQVCKKEKRQFHNLEVLRPKVFITDSSNFKRLVQELTGNNGTSSISPPPPAELAATNNGRIMGMGDQPYQQESSMESLFVEGLIVDSLELCDQLCVSEEAISQVDNDRAYVDYHAAFDASNPMMQAEDLSPYRDFEMWLLDGDDDSCSFFNGYAQSEQQ
ncbi:hypothetical protein Tsubulata_037810 [Turnera subulata]|uniref:VQ domain-containing protein n=1 Tax=Turnera subulata TaxID=218843 RepID=A0A9Q0GHB3_9ROSI|nr:hypothetical protein Tsubulata_037810 [Turnera subulata]